jgi:epoxyqueuosine reductase
VASFAAIVPVPVSSTNMTPAEKTSLIKTLALRLGFDRVGIAPTGRSLRASYYREWLAAGHAGSMRYLHRSVHLRENPSRLLPGARSVICVALSYYRSAGPDRLSDTVPKGRVALYARGRDYHVVLRSLLGQLVTQLAQQLGETFEHRKFVDTGPLLERELAAAAGLGWIGKNTLLLHERLGSYLFLGEVITTLELVPDKPEVDRCGGCTRCLDGCPTHAFPAPYQLDASRCISYLTIEHRAHVPEELHEPISDWVYGCDVCQQVCPFNRHPPDATNPEITADCVPPRIPLIDLLKLRSARYRRLTNRTAARRARRNMWRRNAAIALGNAAQLDLEDKLALAEACDDPDATVRHAAAAALRRHQQ